MDFGLGIFGATALGHANPIGVRVQRAACSVQCVWGRGGERRVLRDGGWGLCAQSTRPITHVAHTTPLNARHTEPGHAAPCTLTTNRAC